MGSLLPEVFRRYDENIIAFTDALDEVLAPVWLAIDCYDAYIDPRLAPDDFLEMLSGWVGFPLDRNWSDEQMRRLVASAVELYRWRGTKRGLVELVRAYTGVEPEVIDSGGTAFSDRPGTAPQGSADASVRVVVDLPAGTASDLARLTRLIASSVPAHVNVTVEVRRASGTTQVVAAELEPDTRALPSATTAGGRAEISAYDSPTVDPYGVADPYAPGADPEPGTGSGDDDGTAP
jgi:phage tail-like protein